MKTNFTPILIIAIMWAGIIGAASLSKSHGPSNEEHQRTYASYYNDNLTGDLMANGHPYNPADLVCASWDFPLGVSVRVAAGDCRSVVVVVSDRGPARRIYARGVKIDLSKAAFQKLAPLSQGLVEVTIERIK